MIKRLLLIICSFLLLCSTASLIACGGVDGDGDDKQPTVEKYVITFYDENGTQLESKEWDEGSIPSYDYSKSEDANYIYTFKGWALTLGGDALTSLPKVTQDANYYAVVTKTSKLATLKTTAINQLGQLVTEALPKLSSQEYKNQLTEFQSEKEDSIQDINTYNGAEEAIAQILQDADDFITKLIAKSINSYITVLKNSMTQGPSTYIPEKMKAGSNLVEENDVTYNFSNFVNVAEITYGGFGEQWNMVLTNIEESERFYKILTATDSIFEVALLEVSDYLLSDEVENVNYSVEKQNYSINLAFTNDVVTLCVEYNTGISNSFFGNITPSVTMTFDIVNNEKEVEIQLSTNNALRYVVTDTKYEFAINYGVSALDRTAYCSFERTGASTVEGHIYEYLTVSSISYASCADFYIGSDYVSVVGNKASGMIGFKGFINELYKTNEGKLLGYEIREEMTFGGVAGTYNTLWFNLDDISGITSVKVLDHELGDEKNKNDIYINGSADIFTPAYNSKLFVKTSRKFDIELRKQYFYYLDNEENLCKLEVEIPMMFIQEDNDKDTNFSDYSSDVLQTNGITSSVTINSNVLTKILSDYDTLIDVFVENKDNTSADTIKNFIQG